jgi:hypothetical protein
MPDEKFWGSLKATCRCRSITLKGGCGRGVVVVHVQVHGPSAEKKQHVEAVADGNRPGRIPPDVNLNVITCWQPAMGLFLRIVHLKYFYGGVKGVFP